jgi:short-subunit dehydrogenase
MTDHPIAVITGGARGIGRQLALDLLERGYHVVIGDLDLDATKATALELGDGASAVRIDVTDRALVAEVIDDIESRVGPIELWVNNAGIMPTGAFAAQPIEVSRAIIDINYAALVEATALVLPRMLARGHGTIVNMASATGIKPLAGVAVYSGTKAAVIAFSEALRRELRGSGVRVIAIAPNLVRTALGAGITPPALSGSLDAAAVSRAIVPRKLTFLLRLSGVLPVRVRDWVDDRAGSDQIGLGGDPAARRAYLADVLDTPDSGPN